MLWLFAGTKHHAINDLILARTLHRPVRLNVYVLLMCANDAHNGSPIHGGWRKPLIDVNPLMVIRQWSLAIM